MIRWSYMWALHRGRCDVTSERALGGRQVRELRVPLEERELDRVGRPVPVLGQDHLSQALLIRFLVVVLVAVDEHDEVGILLYRTAFTQIGKDRPLVVALLDRTRELGHRE